MSGIYPYADSFTTSATTWNAWTNADSTATSIAWSNWNIDCTNDGTIEATGNIWTNGTTTVTMGDTTTTFTGTWYQWLDADGNGHIQQSPVPAAEMAGAQRAHIQEAKEAEERAAKLLREHLTEEQAAQLEKEGDFEVESETGKRYLIARGRVGNVFSLDAKRAKVAKHCIHPVESCPNEDTMLTQLLWLRWNEAEFLKVCNTTGYYEERAA